MDTESFTVLLSLSCTTSHPWVSLNASRADQCGAGTEPRASPRPTEPHAVTHPPPPRLIIFSHPHIPTQTPHKKNSPGASIPSPLAYTHSRESLAVTSYSSLSLDHSHFSCYLSHAPTGPSIHASLEYVIHTHTSLGPAKYINYTFTHVTSRNPLI